jgi:hypothetical protein
MPQSKRNTLYFIAFWELQFCKLSELTELGTIKFYKLSELAELGTIKVCKLSELTELGTIKLPDAPVLKFTDARQARDANRYINTGALISP